MQWASHQSSHPASRRPLYRCDARSECRHLLVSAVTQQHLDLVPAEGQAGGVPVFSVIVPIRLFLPTAPFMSLLFLLLLLLLLLRWRRQRRMLLLRLLLQR